MNTECKAIFAVASFHISLLNFLRLRGVIILGNCRIVMSIYGSISHCFKQVCESVSFSCVFIAHACLSVDCIVFKL